MNIINLEWYKSISKEIKNIMFDNTLYGVDFSKRDGGREMYLCKSHYKLKLAHNQIGIT